ncbi:hypothetical protein LAZ67_X001472 [Cordylochernes scorpioides]|uniref:Uncharacterized protein n=1 Tax=Cordylochernes scorpioides TaxID=51811 RepID=A0ABY6LV11_9ARAC|nr:hypothetical protein LAZ67_X001472 [Cordylochernes scorpioides]
MLAQRGIGDSPRDRDQCYLMLDEPRCQLYLAVVVEANTAGPKVGTGLVWCRGWRILGTVKSSLLALGS